MKYLKVIVQLKAKNKIFDKNFYSNVSSKNFPQWIDIMPHTISQIALS